MGGTDDRIETGSNDEKGDGWPITGAIDEGVGGPKQAPWMLEGGLPQSTAQEQPQMKPKAMSKDRSNIL